MQGTARDLESSQGKAQSTPHARNNELHRHFPNIFVMREAARKALPHFAFEYADGGNGEDLGIQRNWKAFDAIELVPRYGVCTDLPSIDTMLFSRRYSGPIGVAPIGSPSLCLPGADSHLARAAQAANLPYMLGAASGMAIEDVAPLAPDVFWFQLYRLPRDNHRLGFDLVDRADKAGAHVLVLTMDVPVRTARPREVKSGITSPFRTDVRMVTSILGSPMWFKAMLNHGIPRLANFRKYVPNADASEMVEFVRKEAFGAFTWDEVARYRDKWKKPLVLKGIMHPDDAEKAIALGCDGIVVTNHGGRQIDALPPSIDVLPAIAAQVAGRATVMIDSGVRSGSDVVRALALGAEAAFAGKAFLWSLGALGEQGPLHAMDLFIEEIKASLGQIGALSMTAARHALVRHHAKVII